MALSDLIGEEALKGLVGRPFGIDPKSRYKRAEFAQRAEHLFKLERDYNRLKESGGTDVYSLGKIAERVRWFMPGDPASNYAMLMEDPHMALDAAYTLLDKAGYPDMARFVEYNRGTMLRKLTAPNLFDLFSRVPLYKTRDKEHNRLAALRNRAAQIQQERKQGSYGNATSEEWKEFLDAMPKEQKVLYQRHMNKLYSRFNQIIVDGLMSAHGELFRDENGTLNKDRIIAFLKKNYRLIERFMDEIPDEHTEERQDYWDDNLKPQYVEVARELWKPAKDAEEEAKDREEKEREKTAESLGIVT